MKVHSLMFNSFSLFFLILTFSFNAHSFSLKDTHPKVEYKQIKSKAPTPKREKKEPQGDHLQNILDFTNHVQSKKERPAAVTTEVSCNDDEGNRYRTGEQGYQQCLQTKILKQREENRPLLEN